MFIFAARTGRVCGNAHRYTHASAHCLHLPRWHVCARARIPSNANKHHRHNGRAGRHALNCVRSWRRPAAAQPHAVTPSACSERVPRARCAYIMFATYTRVRVCDRMGVVYINRAATAATMHPLTLSYCFHCLHKYTRTSYISWRSKRRGNKYKY